MGDLNLEAASFKLYIFFGIPNIILSGFYCYFYHSLIYYNPLFIIGILSCIPSSYFISKQKKYKECLRKYSCMTLDELEKTKQEILNTPAKHYVIEKQVLKNL